MRQDRVHFSQAASRRRPHVVLVAILALALGSLVFVASASATIMKYADIANLVEISDVIVHGKVIGQSTYEDKTQGFVVTDTIVSVEHVFYGDVAEKVTFQQWGGTFEGTTHFIPGDGTFKDGEEVVLFLSRDSQGSSRLYLAALSQAKYKVHRDEDGRLLVGRDLSDLSFLNPTADGPRLNHVHESKETLESFRATLESLVAGIKGGKK